MAKRGRTIGDLIFDSLQDDLLSGAAFSEEKEAAQLQSMSYRLRTSAGKTKVELSFAEGLSKDQKQRLLQQEIAHLRKSKLDRDAVFFDEMEKTIKNLIDDPARKVELVLKSVIIPDKKTTEGILVKSTSVVWDEIVRRLEKDWDEAFTIPDRTWEEIVAGAFVKAGYENVILTPRSGDFGRDVIASTKGIGCIKVLGSVKAYARGRPVEYDAIRALVGVLTAEHDASKGIITTTSDFPPKVRNDRSIAPFLPFRLELVNGQQLQAWLESSRRERLERAEFRCGGWPACMADSAGRN